MVGPIRSSGIGAIGAIGGARGSSASRAGSAMNTLAGRIAQRMAREFRMFDDERGQGRNQYDAEDLYEIGRMASELSGELGARPTDEGRVLRSLGSFAQESASLIAARPDAASLDTIARAIAAGERPGEPETIDRAVRHIDQTTRDIVEGRPF